MFKKYKTEFILGAVLVVISVFSLFVGVIDVNPFKLITGDAEALGIFVISRLPRLLAILCTGIGMSVAGLIMQQLCMNKFVSPTTGATISSAQFGILIALLFMPDSTIWGRAVLSFISAVLGTWIFVWFIRKVRYKDAVMVPLVILAFIFANHFNIVGMGKDFSKNLGVPYNFVLFSGLTIAAMITASVVVVVGSISYIGLIVPNIVSMFKGDKIRGTLVDTALFGAIFVLVCDIIGRTVIMPYELPIELIVGILGSVIFIGMLLYRLKYGRKAVRMSELLKEHFGIKKAAEAD